MNSWPRYVWGISLMCAFTNPAWANCEKQENNLARVLNEVGRNGEFQAKSQSEAYVKNYMSLPAQELETLLPKLYENLENNIRTISRNQNKLWRDRADVARAELEICNAITVKNSNQSNSNSNTANSIAQSQQQSQQNQSTQQQSQQAQQQAQQAQEAARVAQTRADQARQGKRKTHDPAAEAHQCIDVDTRTLYGGFKNTCSYPVTYGYCVDNPKKGAWTDSPLFSCAGMAGKQTAGGQTIKANGYDTNHTKGGDGVYFFACKAPAHALDLSFVPGQGIQGRCGSLMGN
jgi:hypothetical protein